MTLFTFAKQLTLITILTSVVLALISGLPALQAYTVFSWISLALFVMMTVGMFFAGTKAAHSANKNDFTNVALGFSGAKIALSAITILLFVETVQPATKWFILPFFFVYIVYTGYEMYMLSFIGRIKPNQD
jgi:hypothetical protein